MINQVTLIGHVTYKKELKLSPSNITYISFGLAINENKNQAYFYDLIAFNKNAENLNKYVNVGDLIGINGKLITRKQRINNKQTNELNIFVKSVDFLKLKQQTKNVEVATEATEEFINELDDIFGEEEGSEQN